MGRILAVLLPVVALGASHLKPVTIKDPDRARPVAHPATARQVTSRPHFTVGSVDTIGGSTYDWQANGPIWRLLVNAPECGLHAIWMYSSYEQTTFPDRNMRYNFYDHVCGAWNWIDPDHMVSGVNTFTDRCGFGAIDAVPATGCALVTCHLGSPLYPMVARDMAPGAGIFEYCPGSPTVNGYLWVPMCADQTGRPHVAVIDDASRNNLYYSGVSPWCTWSSPLRIAPPQPDPEFSCQNIAASKVSNKVCVTWEYSNGSPDPGFYRISTDGGATWGASTELLWPDAYGADTLESYHISSLFPFYDRQDRLHIAASIMPYVYGTGYIIPAQIWHWCPDNSPAWSLVTVATCDTSSLPAGVGYNAIFATRPSLGEDNDGDLFVAWGQFDETDVFPGPPTLLCADVFVAGSADNGQNWTDPLKLTDAEDISFRFPSIVDLAIDGGADPDTVCVAYYVDLCPGFFVQGEGSATDNPLVVHRVPVDSILCGYRGAIACPSGGDYWAGGDTCPVRWRINPPDFDSTRVLLSTDGGATFAETLAVELPPTDTLLEWGVPSYNCAGCRVRVEAVTVADDSVVYTTETGDFTIDSEEPTVPALAYPPDSSQIPQYPIELGWHSALDSLSPVSYHLQVAHDSLFADTLALPTPVGPDTWRELPLPPQYDYWWHVRAGDGAGNWSDWSEAWTFYTLVGSEETHGSALAAIGPARPNPFRHTTEVKLVLPEPGGYVHAAVYNSAGRFITDISRYQWRYLSRTKTISWTPGPDVRPGVYYIRCRVDGRDYSQRVVLVE